MNELSDNDLNNIVGGNIGICLGIVAAIIFIAGVIEGYTNPGRCNNE